MKKLLLEAGIVLLSGAVLAFAANALSPRGLSLVRNYFPLDAVPSQAAVLRTNTHSDTQASSIGSVPHELANRAREAGVNLLSQAEAVQLFQEAQKTPNVVVFVDARSTDAYQAGHIPGAYQLDYYHKEDYLPQVLPACMTARQVVVYCAGGSCEDSLLTASVLLAPVISKEKLAVYAGGYTEWTNEHLAVEIGPRNSGRISPGHASAQ